MDIRLSLAPSRGHLAVALIATLLLAAGAFAQKPQAPVAPVSAKPGEAAVSGYDPVSYFSMGKPVKGSADFVHDWMGAKWMFSSAANRDLFAANPEKYAPQFGGYCAFAVSEGYTAPASPEAWKIVDGKLYLNYNESVQRKWAMDEKTRIRKGETNWPKLHE